MVNEWYNRQVDLDAKLSTEIHVCLMRWPGTRVSESRDEELE